MSVPFIDTDRALAEFCVALDGVSALAIDTEFVRETTYYPKLSLIQIASVDDPSLYACIDCVAIKTWQPLFALLSHPDVWKVFHSASQDMEVFYNKFYTEFGLPTPVLDTQIAASFLGYTAQIGYADLIDQELDVQLSKTQTRTNWLRRPLTAEQLQYAADDVIYLAELYPKLIDKLNAQQRLTFVLQDSAALLQPEQYQSQPEAWHRLRRVDKLPSTARRFLPDLYAWREHMAVELDRPRRWIISDQALLNLAEQTDALSVVDQPTVRTLVNRALESGHDFLAEQHQTALCLRLIAAHAQTAIPPLPDRLQLTTSQKQRVRWLEAQVEQQADRLGLDAERLSSRKALKQWVKHQSTIPLLTGWRYEVAGQAIEQQYYDHFDSASPTSNRSGLPIA